MSNNQEVRVGDHKFKIVNGIPALVTAGTDEFTPVTLEDIGNISEWLAVAWESLAGERYQPVIISERGYVADAGYATTRNMVGNGRDAIAARAEALASTYDDGNGLERDCE